MFVWRIENEAGIGPYQSGFVRASGLGLSTNEYHPEPDTDIPTVKDMKSTDFIQYFFGFRSVSDLQKWFDSRSMVKMYARGYRVVKYQVEKTDMLRGTRQVMFKKKRAKVVLKHESCLRFL